MGVYFPDLKSVKTYFNERKKELKDEKILDALEKCKEMYMNGRYRYLVKSTHM